MASAVMRVLGRKSQSMLSRSEIQTGTRTWWKVVAPYVQHTAVLRHFIFRHRTVRLLHRLRSPMVTLPCLLPRLHRLWRHETLHCCVRDAEESIRALLNDALYRSRRRLNHLCLALLCQLAAVIINMTVSIVSLNLVFIVLIGLVKQSSRNETSDLISHLTMPC